jgi:hypothetical protein
MEAATLAGAVQAKAAGVAPHRVDTQHEGATGGADLWSEVESLLRVARQYASAKASLDVDHRAGAVEDLQEA